MVDILYPIFFKLFFILLRNIRGRWKQIMIAPHNIAPHLWCKCLKRVFILTDICLEKMNGLFTSPICFHFDSSITSILLQSHNQLGKIFLVWLFPISLFYIYCELLMSVIFFRTFKVYNRQLPSEQIHVEEWLKRRWKNRWKKWGILIPNFQRFFFLNHFFKTSKNESKNPNVTDLETQFLWNDLTMSNKHVSVNNFFMTLQ